MEELWEENRNLRKAVRDNLIGLEESFVRAQSLRAHCSSQTRLLAYHQKRIALRTVREKQMLLEYAKDKKQETLKAASHEKVKAHIYEKVKEKARNKEERIENNNGVVLLEKRRLSS